MRVPRVLWRGLGVGVGVTLMVAGWILAFLTGLLGGGLIFLGGAILTVGAAGWGVERQPPGTSRHGPYEDKPELPR